MTSQFEARKKAARKAAMGLRSGSPASPSTPRDSLDRLREYPRSPMAQAAQKLYSTDMWKRTRAIARQKNGGICCVCGHGGSDSAQHWPPVSERPNLDDFFDLDLLLPIHHHPCKVCHQRCNQVAGMGSLERARRIIKERNAAAGLEVPDVEPEPEVKAAVHPSGRTFTTVSEALAVLEPTIENLEWLWSNGNYLACEHGPAESEGRCDTCLPCGSRWDRAIRTGTEPGEW